MHFTGTESSVVVKAKKYIYLARMEASKLKQGTMSKTHFEPIIPTIEVSFDQIIHKLADVMDSQTIYDKIKLKIRSLNF